MIVVSLDHLFWMPGGFNEKRPKAEAAKEIRKASSAPQWIAEGVFGELAEMFLPSADRLIYLDVDWPTCQIELLARSSENSKQLDHKRAEENFRNPLGWAERYWQRDDPRSHVGHPRLRASFAGQRTVLRSRMEANAFVEEGGPSFKIIAQRKGKSPRRQT